MGQSFKENLTVLKEYFKDSDRITHIVEGNTSNKAIIVWTGDRPDILTKILLCPLYEVRINYIEKRAEVEIGDLAKMLLAKL